MGCLIINTLPKIDNRSNEVIKSIAEKNDKTEIFDLNEYKIGPCIGCTNCWLKTPGICAVKDDWEIVFKKILKSESVVFLAETHFGFVSHKMKNIVDRLIPLLLPYTKLSKGQMRHKNRYKKCWNIGLIFTGNGNKDFLNDWMGRFALNFFSKSLGAYNINDSEGLYREISNI